LVVAIIAEIDGEMAALFIVVATETD